MKSFADWQDAFQKAILHGDDAVLATLTDGAREKREALFEVYRHAYGARLVEAMGKENEVLYGFLGDDTFAEVANAYILAHPSRHPSIRWVSRHLPAFLRATEPYSDYPVVADLASLEQALNDAFDGLDGPVLAGDALTTIPPEAWQDLVVTPHPTARRLTLTTNAGAVWSAVRADEEAPEPETLAEPAEILVWRHDSVPMWRQLSPDEAMAWDEAADRLPFGQLCVMLATREDAEGAAGRAASYLVGWIGAGLLAEARVDRDRSNALPCRGDLG